MTKWLRFADLKANGIVRNRATLSRWIRNLGFPPGVMIGLNTRAWPEAQIEAWLAERARASAETEAPEMETAAQGGGGGAEVNSKSVGPASYKYFAPLAQAFRVPTPEHYPARWNHLTGMILRRG